MMFYGIDPRSMKSHTLGNLADEPKICEVAPASLSSVPFAEDGRHQSGGER